MSVSGIAKVKKEYIVPDHKRELVEDFVTPEAKSEIEKKPQAGTKRENDEGGDNSSEPPSKKMKLKGRNKKRHMNTRFVFDANKLCHAFVQGAECRFGDKCKFSHDVESFMKTKPNDIGDNCYLFKTFGKCPFSFACRFGKSHLTEDYKNIINEDLCENSSKEPSVLNVINKSLQEKLRHKKFDFSIANKIVKQIDKLFEGKEFQDIVNDSKLRPSAKGQSDDKESENHDIDKETENCSEEKLTEDRREGQQTENHNNDKETENYSEEKQTEGQIDDKQTEKQNHDNVAETTGIKIFDIRNNSGCLTDEDIIKLRPQEKKKINFADKLYLAPLTTEEDKPNSIKLYLGR